MTGARVTEVGAARGARRDARPLRQVDRAPRAAVRRAVAQAGIVGFRLICIRGRDDYQLSTKL